MHLMLTSFTSLKTIFIRLIKYAKLISEKYIQDKG